MTIATLIVALCQLGMGAGAWKLANRLAITVGDHEIRITKLEAK